MLNKEVSTISGKEQIADVMEEIADAIETGQFGQKVRVGLTTPGSEHGEDELCRAAAMVERRNDDIEPVLIGSSPVEGVDHHSAADLEEAHDIMEDLFSQDDIDCAVTLHYSFPLGVATVGRVISPCSGEEMLLATTTGSSATDRVEAMVRNALSGLAAARSLGLDQPELGILNVEGARKVEKALNELKESGLNFRFAESVRGDGGSVMRGNDLLVGSCDVMVCDTLTGNLLMKLFSAREGGGVYEVSGFGYGPGIGPGQDNIIGIVSRASGAPVIARAMEYMAEAYRGGLNQEYDDLLDRAEAAGLEEVLETEEKDSAGGEEIAAPPEKKTDVEISGVDVLDIESARESLWKRDIYAETGMGCSGPVVMVSDDDEETARAILNENGYL